MANPSLQIGNDNWAIKEDNLLGYSTAGTRFVPQPITMTRATAGTRVNPSGLVEDVELLGIEEVEDGNFPTPNTEWDLFNGATVSAGKANIVGDGSVFGYISQSSVFTSGKTYKVTLDAVITSGGGLSVKYSTAYADNIGFITTTGSYTFYYIATSDYNLVIGRTQSGVAYDSSVTNISVKEATIDNLPRVDYTDGTSSLLVEPQRTNTITYSEDFSQSSWFKTSGVTLTSNYGVSPDGNNNSTRLQLSTNNEQIYYSIIHSGSTETASIYVKGTSGETIQFGVGNNISQGGTYTLNGEWQRINQQSTSGSVVIIGNKDSTATDFEIWAGQFEIGSYPTSYIKTSGQSGGVTRVQEAYKKTGISDKIGQTEGTFFIELSKPVLSPDNYITISLNNAASNSIDNTLTIGFKNSNEYYIRLRAGGTSAFTSGNTASLANTFYKIAVSYKSTESLIYIDGSPITPNGGSLSNDFAFTATLDNLSFDLDGDDTSPFYGNVKQLQIFKTALKDEQLKTLTT